MPAQRFPGGNPNGPEQWIGNQPTSTGYTPPAQTPINSAPNVPYPIGGTAQSTNPLQPSPGEIAATAPANIQQFGATPVINPTYAQAAQQSYLTGNAAQQGYAAGNANLVDPNSAQSYLNQYGQMLMAGLQPGFQQQDQALAQSLASRGITNSGSAAQLEGNLQGQQAAAFANAYSPMIGQAFGYQQQDLTGNQAAQNQFGLANLGYANTALGQNAAYQQQMGLADLGYGNAALGANAGYQQQANLTNAAASNQTNELNAGYYNQDRYTNAGAYNQYQNELFNQGSSVYGTDLAAYLNSFGPSTGVTNAMSQGLAGEQNIYGQVYGAALGQQQQQENQAAMLLAMGG